MRSLVIAAVAALAFATLASPASAGRHPLVPPGPYRLDDTGHCHAANGQFVAMNSCAPHGATAECRDATWSFSRHHEGTCSHHGGVLRWL
jgi:hypothetical protein